MKRMLGFTIEDAEICPGTTGVLIEEQPRLTHAHVRPFVWAVLLYRGAVHSWEVVNALSAVCSIEDMKISDDNDDDDDRTWAEIVVNEVLGEMVVEGLLEYSDDKDIWVLRYNSKNLPTVLTAVSGIDGRMPQHFLLEMGRENY